MKSNIGTRQLKDFGQGVGFATSARTAAVSDDAKSLIEKSLKKAFAPEFLNRIDDVLLFNPLAKEDIHKIIDIELKSLYKRLNELNYEVKISDKAKDYIADKGYDANFGARPLKRAIQRYLEDPMAEQIIGAQINEGDTINIDLDTKKEEIIINIIKAAEKEKEKKPKKSSSKE